ncbi:MAG: response regulator, partial [Acidobacteriota bacterium]
MQAVKARVLIVDDDQRVRSLLQQLLEREGYDTETASDGASAIAAMADRAPDLVLLDVNMPGQSGFDVCRRIRQDATTRLTPVVIVT